MTDLLTVEGLKTHLFLKRGVVKAVDGVSFSLAKGETLGLIGESGSGKTMCGLSLLGILPKPSGRIVEGSIQLEGRELVGLPEADYSSDIRGEQIAMISQDPMTSLNPVFKVGTQVAAPIVRHGLAPRSRAMDVAIEELGRVHVPSAARRAHEYPHQFSGGMRQRVVAAMALSCRPKVLIADEPTSALDVTIQLQFMGLIEELQASTGVALIFITHDLGVAASLCHRIAVMYAGRIVEIGDVETMYADPVHPYTRGLLESVPRLGVRRKRLYTIGGSPPDPLAERSGCAFAPRCPDAVAVCHEKTPPEVDLGDGHRTLCWLPESASGPTTHIEDVAR